MLKKSVNALLIVLTMLSFGASAGEQVILKKDFSGYTMRKTRYVDGWSLLSYCPGELSREKGTLKLKAMSAGASGQSDCSRKDPLRRGPLPGRAKDSGKNRFLLEQTHGAGKRLQRL